MTTVVFCILLALAAFEIGIHLFSVLVIVPIFERRLAFDVTASEPDSAAERIEIPTTDGLTLRGALHRPVSAPLGIIIFSSEFRSNHWKAMDYCQALLDFGFAILAFDFRGQGESDVMPGYDPLHWPTDFEVRDLRSVVSFARAHEDLASLPIGLMGVSRGAGTALFVAAQDDQIKCVVADSAFTTDTLMVLYAARWVQHYAPRWFRLPEWHLHISCRLARWVSELRRRVRHPGFARVLPRLRRHHVLLIAGRRDTYVPCESSRRIQLRIGGDSEVWYVPKAKHNNARQTMPLEYDRRILKLFMNMVPVEQQKAVLADLESVGDP